MWSLTKAKYSADETWRLDKKKLKVKDVEYKEGGKQYRTKRLRGKYIGGEVFGV